MIALDRPAIGKRAHDGITLAIAARARPPGLSSSGGASLRIYPHRQDRRHSASVGIPKRPEDGLIGSVDDWVQLDRAKPVPQPASALPRPTDAPGPIDRPGQFQDVAEVRGFRGVARGCVPEPTVPAEIEPQLRDGLAGAAVQVVCEKPPREHPVTAPVMPAVTVLCKGCRDPVKPFAVERSDNTASTKAAKVAAERCSG